MLEANKKNYYLVISFGLIACMIYGLGAAIRGCIGIFLVPMADQCGIEYKDVSLCIAVMQIIFGASQPFFGILASKKSNRFILFLGVFFLASSMIGIIVAKSFLMLFLSLGILLGLGTGAIAFGIVLTSAIYYVGQENAMTISAMLNAAAGLVSFLLAPFINFLIETGGIKLNSIVLTVVIILLLPLSIILTSKDPVNSNQADKKIDLPFKEAFSSRTYLLLLAGFSTCGFHMVIIESHLFSQLVSYDIESSSASWIFSFYGIATIFGALLSGYLSTKIDKGKLLSFYYGSRAVFVCLYMFCLPKNVISSMFFSIVLGLTGDATVSPTSGLVNERFNIKSVATLLGLLFLVHQIGAFFSAYIGGIIISEDADYSKIWIIDIALCIFASVMSFLIRSPKVKN